MKLITVFLDGTTVSSFAKETARQALGVQVKVMNALAMKVKNALAMKVKNALAMKVVNIVPTRKIHAMFCGAASTRIHHEDYGNDGGYEEIFYYTAAVLLSPFAQA
jgi:hypothetical protein